MRTIFSWCAACLALVLTVGCASTGSNPQPLDLSVRFSFDKSVYQPGEAVKIVVALTNNTEKPKVVRQLDASSVVVAYNRMGDNETPLLREPISPTGARLGLPMELAPGAAATQTFVLTRLTHYTGPMLAQVHYDPNPQGTVMNGPKVFSEPEMFEVSGTRLVERDSDGLIMKDEAIRLAKAQVAEPVKAAQAILVEDKASGYYQFWVNLTTEGPDGRIVSYMVDPYYGRALAQAKPFNPKFAEDARLQRPDGLPPRQIDGTLGQLPASAAPVPPPVAPAPAAGNP